MSQTCAQHPDRESEGACLRCGKATCALCKVEVDGSVFCSVLCFTEGPSTVADPLAGVGLDPSSVQVPQATPLDDESVVLPASQAASPDLETSILDMGNTSLKDKDHSDVSGGGSSVMDVPALEKDNTSILGMDSIPKPQGAGEKMPYVMPVGSDGPASDADAMMPIVLPGTRRTTIQSSCVFHPDTPAVVMCSKCGDPICTMCVDDAEHGGRCAPQCRRNVKGSESGKKSGLLTAAVAALAALVLVGGYFLMRKPEDVALLKAPKVVEIAKADPSLEKKAREEAEAKVRAEKDAKEKEEAAAKATAEKKAKEEADAKARAEKEAKEKAEAEAMAAKAAAEKKAREEAEAKAAAESLAKAEADKKAKEEAEAKAKAEAMAAKAASEKKAKEEAEAKAKAEKDSKEKEEARLKAEAMAKANAEAEARAREEARLKAEADAKAKRDAEANQLESSLLTAAALIREATPDFKELAALLDPGVAAPGDIRKDSARTAALEKKLSDARAEYVRVLATTPDREKVQWRIEVLGELISTLDGGLARVKSDRMQRQAAQRFNEAMPLYKRFTSRIREAKDPSEREGWLASGELARVKLDEARSLYRELKFTSREPGSYDIKLSTIDELIESLDGELKSASRK